MINVLPSIDPEPRATEPGRFDRILVAIDDPRGSYAAVLHAIDLALVARGALVCAIVICSEALPGENEPGSNVRVDNIRNEAGAYLKAVTELGAARGLAVEGIVLEGSATDAILEAAVARDVTSIVVCAEQRRVLERLLFGSAADSILRRRCLPVTVVRS
jgi:nucleotide-binding universal stress UspA family protein